ncbi:MAG: hypothetical protein Tsb0018_11140 [Opitutales bacterium]
MIQLKRNSQIKLCVSPVDFRKGIDGLCGLCRHELTEDPKTGVIFGFINRSRIQVKLLYYDGTGFWLMTKRLSKGRFPSWPKNGKGISEYDAKKLTILLRGENPEAMPFTNGWTKVGENNVLQ